MNFKVIHPRAFETRRGLHWDGILTVDGAKVCRFENSGDGGCMYLDWKPGAGVPSIEAALKATVPPETFEPVDAAIGLLWDTAMLAEA